MTLSPQLGTFLIEARCVSIRILPSLRGKNAFFPLADGTGVHSRDRRCECFWLCPRKWLMLFSLKFQRNNRKNALPMNSAKGKDGEKVCIFTVL
ncbi:hypothetical protein [uncultured Bilophila sp.]|uniref:hypothetical protein n=1 Tax=uncultured Bilophila sp. TaxID=529385 RepID=UPI00266F7656|nr:hypothetical protein [uncultured Bilophila sp.]